MEQSNLINSTYRKNVENVQNNVSTEIATENNIAKILCTQAKSFIDNYEALAGEIKFNGTVCFSVTYESTEGEFFTLSNTEKFNGKVENELITASTKAIFNSNVIELKVDSSSNEVRLTAVTETETTLFLNDIINYYLKNSDEIVTNSNFINYQTLKF